MSNQIIIDKLKEIKSNDENIVGTKRISYDGMNSEVVNTYKINLDYLQFNPHNTRIVSDLKEFEILKGSVFSNLSPTKQKEEISNILWDKFEERNKKTKKDIKQKGQLVPGVITSDGLVVDGNRRFMILNKLLDEGIRLEFEAVILDITYEDSAADALKIKKLETSIQLASDKEVTYDPIDKYIRVADFKDNHNINNAEIANTMGFESEEKVQEIYEIFKLMDNYLKFIHFKDVYSRLSKKEDLFINFNKCLKLYRRGLGRPGWSFDKEDDVDDFENIGYNLIRWIYSCPHTNMNPKDIRKLYFTNSNSQTIFSDKNIWNDFTKSIDLYELDKVMPAGKVEKKLETYIESGMKAKDAALKIDQEWAEGVSDTFRGSIKYAKDKIENKNLKDKPSILIKDSLSKLEQLIDVDLFKDKGIVKISDAVKESLKLNKSENFANSNLLRKISETIKKLLS